MYGVVNFKHITTEPGSQNAFAPPIGFSGNYREFMVAQMQNDPGVRQHVACVALRMPSPEPPVFSGPYADLAKQLALVVHKRLAAKHRKESDE